MCDIATYLDLNVGGLRIVKLGEEGGRDVESGGSSSAGTIESMLPSLAQCVSGAGNVVHACTLGGLGGDAMW